MWEKLEKINFEILLDKFVQEFNVNHITIDIMNLVSRDNLKQYIINKFIEECGMKELKEIFNI